MQSWFVLIPLVVLLGGCGSDQDKGSGQGSEGGDVPALQPYKYKAGIEGLEQLMGDLMVAIEKDDRPTARMLAESFAIPDQETWFGEFFGEEVKQDMAAEYDDLGQRIAQLVDLLTELQEQGQTKILVESFESQDDPAAVEYQSLALQRMVRAIPLYSVRLSAADGKKTFHLWSFIYDDGMYRYIGKTKALAKKPPKESEGGIDPREFRRQDRKKVREILQPEQPKGKSRQRGAKGDGK